MSKKKADPQDLVNKLMDQVAAKAAADGMSIQAISDEEGFQRANVSRMLNYRSIPRLDIFIRLCRAAGLEVTLTPMGK